VAAGLALRDPTSTASFSWGDVADRVTGSPAHRDIQRFSKGVFQMKLSSRVTTGLLLLAVVLPQAGRAQASKFIGLVGGATLSELTDYYGGISTGTKWGGNGGLLLGMRTANGIVLSLEPAWTQMGAKLSGSNASLDYIEVPLTVGGMTAGQGNVRYGGYLGIAPSFNLTCKISDPVGACDNAKGTAWFLPIGFRILTKASSGMIAGLDIRYMVPLGSSFDNLTVHQRSWAFRIILAKESH